MWIMLNDAFLSIVAKDCPRSSLMVRARRQGDIERIFPDAVVRRSTDTDYLYRAVVPRDQVESAMVGEIRRISYANFKSSVEDKPLHDAYLRCWHAMASLQHPRQFSAIAGPNQHTMPFDDAHVFATGHMPEEEFGGRQLRLKPLQGVISPGDTFSVEPTKLKRLKPSGLTTVRMHTRRTKKKARKLKKGQ